VNIIRAPRPSTLPLILELRNSLVSSR
jgi:hypothetical protein